VTAARPVVVTGASGFVGRHLSNYLAGRGWAVRGLVRDTTQGGGYGPGIELFRCVLPEEIDPAPFRGAQAVIHCAYATRAATVEEARRVNEEGTARVYGLSQEAGVDQFVFLSSTSAHEAAASFYGQSKFAIERRLDPTRDLIIRPGLVLGKGGGLFDRVVATVRRARVVPLLDGGRQIVQTVYVDDLCVAIERALDQRLVGRYVVAEPEGLLLRDLLRLVAARLGRSCLFISVPAAPVLAVVRGLEGLGIRLPVSSENVLGLTTARMQPSTADLATIGVTVRSAAESLALLLAPASR